MLFSLSLCLTFSVWISLSLLSEVFYSIAYVNQEQHAPTFLSCNQLLRPHAPAEEFIQTVFDI